MFNMKSKIARNADVDLEDQANVKFSLTALGYHDDSEEGLSPYSSNKFFDGIRKFQEDLDLKIDGVINPEGETHQAIKTTLEKTESTAGAYKDFLQNYLDMRQANTKESDKYFHCKANYQATRRGWDGGSIASYLSDTRENVQRKFGESRRDEIEDQVANYYGRNAATYGDFEDERDACEIFRPDTLSDQY